VFAFACSIGRLDASPARALPVSLRAAILPAQGLPAEAQPGSCPAVPEHEPTPAEAEYREGRYDMAENLYRQELSQHPNDLNLAAALSHTLLREGEIGQASAQVAKAREIDPHSVITLTALAEFELKRGEPWLSLETLGAAEAADPCYARAHLVRSRAFRLNSRYASERAEIEKAYAVDPNDPDIKHAWLSVVAPAKDVEGIAEALATMKDLDPDTRQKAQQALNSMLPMLSENTQTCKVVPAVASSIVLPLLPTYQDARHIDGYKLEVQLPQSKARLQVDTAASGLFVSRALADLNGLQPGKGDPEGTVRADRIQIGPLEFRSCLVGVSDTPFADKSDGFIGTDIFSSYLITLDQPGARLTLAPLPPTGSIIPVDRPSSTALPAELKGFTPVYHRMQYLLVPVMLDGKARRLFILDSGIRSSTMRSEVAHLVSTTKVNFTNPVLTVSGTTLQVYRDSFDFELANLSLNHQDHILEMDTSAIDQNAGMQIAGLLGFDMLHSFVMHLDYRDGLVKLESQEAAVSGGPAAGALVARKAADQDCNDSDTRDRPLTTALQAQVMGLLDSGRLRRGQEVTVKLVNGWSDDECTLGAGDLLYGHVTSAGTAHSSDSSELSLMFDRAECDRGARPLNLRLIAVVAAPDQFKGLHTALPSQVAGGGRSISNLAGDTRIGEDINLNPTGPPHTVHPGVVVGIPSVELDPLGGPGCSARIFSSDKSVRLGVGAVLLFTRQSAH
jgi:tetratricopeptide (TPR) repeat protein